MNRLDSRSASQKVTQLRSKFHVELVRDWGPDKTGGKRKWNAGTWSMAELERLRATILLLAKAMGGAERFVLNLGGVAVEKKDIGSHGGEAYAHHVRLSAKGNFSAWTVVHELAHAWDAHAGWRLSVELEKATGGFTSPLLSWFKKISGTSDSRLWRAENTPGRQGRLPGCNAAGYFYGDRPSGSNWHFNRKEDFAESVAMYIGWRNANELSPWAEARIQRYQLANGAAHKSFGVDNWADYAKYFYPPDGDYRSTKRWKFVDDLMHGKIAV